MAGLYLPNAGQGSLVKKNNFSFNSRTNIWTSSCQSSSPSSCNRRLLTFLDKNLMKLYGLNVYLVFKGEKFHEELKRFV